MVLDTQTTSNGEQVSDPASSVMTKLPELITITATEARRIPSPGAQRALKAETGRGFDELCGPDADGADRTQTMVWMKLRRTYPELRWHDCSEVSVQVEEGGLEDPTSPGVSETLPGSAVSGG